MLIKKDLVAREEMSKEASRLLEYSRDTLHQVPSLFAQYVRYDYKRSEPRIHAEGVFCVHVSNRSHRLEREEALATRPIHQVGFS
jgi:hypothetical protein